MIKNLKERTEIKVYGCRVVKQRDESDKNYYIFKNYQHTREN